MIELMYNLKKKCILGKFKLIHRKFSVNIFVDFWVLFHLKQGGSDAIVEVWYFMEKLSNFDSWKK